MLDIPKNTTLPQNHNNDNIDNGGCVHLNKTKFGKDNNAAQNAFSTKKEYANYQ